MFRCRLLPASAYLNSAAMRKPAFLENIYQKFSRDIALDLGTANTRVYVKDHGILVSEPSVVAVNQKTGRVVAVGTEARQMLGRTPLHISAERPMVEGVISNFEVAEEMVRYFLHKAESALARKYVRPRVLVSVPSGITNVERRAVRDAVRNAGTREVHVIEGPVAAAIGISLPINEPVGSMIVLVGGGTVDIALLSLSGIVRSKNLRMAGDRLNSDIVTYVKDEFKILLGDRMAEEVKIAIGSVYEEEETKEAAVRGRDLVTGLPREVILTDRDIREAIMPAVAGIINAVKEVLESTPPEIVADVMRRGIALAGGGALIRGLDFLLKEELKIPVYLVDDPLTAVVRGEGIVLENMDYFQDLLLDSEDEISQY